MGTVPLAPSPDPPQGDSPLEFHMGTVPSNSGARGAITVRNEK